MTLMGRRQWQKEFIWNVIWCIICLGLFAREVPCKGNAMAKLFNKKDAGFLLCCTIYSRIKGPRFYTTLTGKARQGQAEIN